MVDIEIDWSRVTKRTVTDVLKERVGQDTKYGGQQHDDGHKPDDWTDFIIDKTVKGYMAASHGRPEEYRRRMVQIAALAIAAVDSYDRKNPTAENEETKAPVRLPILEGDK